MRPSHYDLVGVGFGPANLALAVQLNRLKQSSVSNLELLFLEKQRATAWHSGMLLPDSSLQIHFLKDLVTSVDPCSPFSFVNFLKTSGRLFDFINLRTNYPSREEYNEYLQWVASHFENIVQYDSTVQRIRTQATGDVIDDVVLEYQHRGTPRQVTASNVVLACGRSPNIPAAFGPLTRRIVHSSAFTHWLAEVGPNLPTLRVLVVGSGQSAAEIFCHLLDKCSRGRVVNLIRKYGYTPADSSSFSNQIFDPDFVDYFFELPLAARDEINDACKTTNYSCVDDSLIASIYQQLYVLKRAGHDRTHKLLRHAEVASVHERADGVAIAIRELFTGRQWDESFDYVILATGYQSHVLLERMLEPLHEFILRDEQGRIRLERDYRVATTSRLRAGLYVAGYGEHTHGLTDTLLSILPVRAEKIVHSVTSRTARP